MEDDQITKSINDLYMFSRTLRDVYDDLQKEINDEIRKIQKSCPHNKIHHYCEYEDRFTECEICGKEL